MQPVTLGPARHLLVLACSARKRSFPAGLAVPAWDLYDGQLFRLCRRVQREQRWPRGLLVMILSAEHGLIPADRRVETYDRRMTRRRAADLRQGVGAKLAEIAALHPVEEAYLALGRTYALAVQDAFPPSVRVVDGGDMIGRMQTRLRAWLADPPASPAMQLALALPCRARGSARPLCFASGANEPGEIRGFVSIGIPVGVSAAEIGPDALNELQRLAGLGIPVFVDSGAYGEVARRSGTPTRSSPAAPLAVVREIADVEWECRLALYLRLARSLGRQLFAVTPDRVGDQDVSLRRMATHADAIRAMAAAGASLLLPLHCGALSLPAYYAAAQRLLRVPLVPAFPMPKARASASDILQTISLLQPAGIHLLGLGPRSARARDLLRLLRLRAPAVHVSMDANLVVSAVGRFPDGSPARPLTRAQDAIRARGFPDVFGEVADPEWNIHVDYTDSISLPSEWIGPAGLRAVAASAGLDSRQSARWFRDPDAFLQEAIHETEPDGPARWEDPALAFALDGAWRHYLDRRHTAPRKAEAIRRTFATHPAAGQFAPPRLRRTGVRNSAAREAA